jgi:hypothetical protein
MPNKLRVHKVTRDGDGNELSRVAIAKMPVITDVQNDVAAVLSVDYLDVVALVYNRIEGVIHMHFALGSEDANGKFHMYKEKPDVRFSVAKGDPLWDDLGMETRTVFDLDQLKQFVHNKKGVEAFDRQVWKEGDLESTLETV